MKTGRKSKAEEMGLLPRKEELLAEIASLDLANSEIDCGRVSMLAARGHVEGVLSEPECKSLQRAAAAALKAVQQAKADQEIARLEALHKATEEREQRVRQETAAARTRAQ
jgi:multidrug resistance efflux pump